MATVWALMACFNPRAHGGRDPDLILASPLLSVSIHAPTGGATGDGLEPSTLRLCFNPRAHGGRDLTKPVVVYRGTEFQSTRPRGARRLSPPRTSRRFCFNPRAHGGRDVITNSVNLNELCFNPRAHGGRDPLLVRLVSAVQRVSIHAPTGGATFCSENFD